MVRSASLLPVMSATVKVVVPPPLRWLPGELAWLPLLLMVTPVPVPSTVMSPMNW